MSSIEHKYYFYDLSLSYKLYENSDFLQFS